MGPAAAEPVNATSNASTGSPMTGAPSGSSRVTVTTETSTPSAMTPLSGVAVTVLRLAEAPRTYPKSTECTVPPLPLTRAGSSKAGCSVASASDGTPTL